MAHIRRPDNRLDPYGAADNDRMDWLSGAPMPLPSPWRPYHNGLDAQTQSRSKSNRPTGLYQPAV